MFTVLGYYIKMRRLGLTTALAAALCASSFLVLIVVNNRPAVKRKSSEPRLQSASKQFREFTFDRDGAVWSPADESKIAAKPTWFHPDVLLQNAVTSREARRKIKAMVLAQSSVQAKLPEQQKSTVDTSMEILAQGERCTINYVGCFFNQILPPFLKNQIEVVGRKTAKDCIRQCSLRRIRYAAVFHDGRCTCGESVGAPTMLTRTEYCNKECPDDRSQICGGASQLSVYRITKFCVQTKLTALDVEGATLGCYQKSKEIDLQFPEGLDNVENAAACLLQCEKSNKLLASWDNMGMCRCGAFDESFSLLRSGQKVDISICEREGCPPGAVLCSSKHVRIMKSNVDNQACGMKKFVPTDVGRLVALISFPGSGNTWVRYLIESATGIYTGSIYSDKDLYEQGFLGEKLAWNSKRTSVIKTHSFTPDSVRGFSEAIFIIRNPYDAILAEFNRLKGGHVGHADESLFQEEEWTHFISYKIEKWFNTCKAYSTKEKLLVVFFEDIVANPMVEVKRMVDFLKYPVEDLRKRMACLESNVGGNFKRKRRKLSFDPFPRDLKEKVNNYIASARRKLTDLGLPEIPPYERD